MRTFMSSTGSRMRSLSKSLQPARHSLLVWLTLCALVQMAAAKATPPARPAGRGGGTASSSSLSPTTATGAAEEERVGAEQHSLSQFNPADPYSPKLSDFNFDKQLNPFMQVHKLSRTSNNITCNDGSQVGYYMRLNSHSKSWIIYLQGGGFCGSEQSCQQRWQRSPHLMSSNYWPRTKTVDGILSSEPKENPYLWNANHIYVPYCSSDSWTGEARANGEEGKSPASSFAFLGSKILERVLDSLYEDLPRDSSLYEAKFILLAGDSAGATGVILNLDKVNEIVERKAQALRPNCSSEEMAATDSNANCQTKQQPVLRGLADSGWFLDNEPYVDFPPTGATQGEQQQDQANQSEGPDCDRSRCTPLQSIRQAMRLWNGQVPQACAIQYQNEPWRCYFGYRAYQTLKTPLFVVQWLYDEAQLMVDNIARPGTSGQWNYVNKVVNEMRASLENVTALFAPSCFSHSLIARRSWNQININGFKLPHVLNSWEEQSLLDTTAIASRQMKASNEVIHTFGIHDTIAPTDRTSQHFTTANSSLPSIVNQPTFETVLVSEAEGRSLPSFGAAINSEQNHPFIPLQMAPMREHLERPSMPELRHISHSRPSSATGSSRPRATRKRKRNNHQQRTKNSRQKSSNSQQSESSTLAPEVTVGGQTATPTPALREMNDLSSSAANPIQDLLPLIDRSLASADFFLSRGSSSLSGGRLGRSTLVDDATLMLGNNVPEDNNPANQMMQQNFNQDHRQLDTRWSAGDSRFSSSFNGGLNLAPQSHILHYGSNADRFRLIDSCGWPQCNRDCPVLELDYNSAAIVQF